MSKLSVCLAVIALLPVFAINAEAATIYGLTADREVDGAGATSDVSTMRAGYAGSTGINPVFVFQLPTLPAGKEFSATSIRIYFTAMSGTPTFNGDLYGIGASSSSAVLAGDYYAGALDANAQLIQDNLVTPAAGTGPKVSSASVLTDYLNAAYANGAGAGQYVLFRVSPDVAGLTNNFTRYNTYSSEAPSGSYYYPSITYSTADVQFSGTTLPSLMVTGTFSAAGNTSTFGTQGTLPGLSLNYTPGSTAGIDFSASSASANWLWKQGANPQLKLSNSNMLTLYDPATGAPSLTLNPAGTSTFSTQTGAGVTTELLRLQSGTNATGTAQRISGQADVLSGYVDFKRFASAGPATGLTLGTFGGDVLTIRSSGAADAGNVGIGTDAPAAKLDVAGDAQVRGKLRIAPSGDLLMGGFATGANPATP